MKIRPVKWVVCGIDAPIFQDGAFGIEVVDEGAGEFVTVTSDEAEIRIEPKDWPMLKLAIEQALGQCKEEKR